MLQFLPIFLLILLMCPVIGLQKYNCCSLPIFVLMFPDIGFISIVFSIFPRNSISRNPGGMKGTWARLRSWSWTRPLDVTSGNEVVTDRWKRNCGILGVWTEHGRGWGHEAWNRPLDVTSGNQVETGRWTRWHSRFNKIIRVRSIYTLRNYTKDLIS